MGRVRFSENCQKNYIDALAADNGTTWGAVQAAFTLIVIVPCQVVWNFFMIPAERADSGAGGLGMICCCCCCFPASLLIVVTFLVCLSPGILAAIIAAFYGLSRNTFCHSDTKDSNSNSSSGGGQ